MQACTHAPCPLVCWEILALGFWKPLEGREGSSLPSFAGISRQNIEALQQEYRQLRPQRRRLGECGEGTQKASRADEAGGGSPAGKSGVCQPPPMLRTRGSKSDPSSWDASPVALQGFGPPNLNAGELRGTSCVHIVCSASLLEKKQIKTSERELAPDSRDITFPRHNHGIETLVSTRQGPFWSPERITPAQASRPSVDTDQLCGFRQVVAHPLASVLPSVKWLLRDRITTQCPL